MKSLWTVLVNWFIIGWMAPENVYFHLEGYMERWWIRRPKEGRKWTCRLHHILRSDEDRHLHDHPWPYVTIILKGGYWEVTPVSGRAIARSAKAWDSQWFDPDFGPDGNYV